MGTLVGNLAESISLDDLEIYDVPLTWNWQEHIGWAKVYGDGTIIAEVDEEHADLFKLDGEYSIGTESR